MSEADPRLWLVAHRGWPHRYTENSLEGARAVLNAGARFIEFDVQVTADGQPVVIHDDTLGRLAGRSARITCLPAEQLSGLMVSSGTGPPAAIPSLRAMLSLIGRYAGVTAFVELKRHSITRHGHRQAVRSVMRELERAPCPVVFLSFKSRAVRHARALGVPATGWVFRPWSVVARWQARRLQPDYLFIRADRIPRRPRPLWPGRWQWVVYGVDSLQQARELRARGAHLVEVDDLPGMLEQA